eukprot:TRINITY_DN1281_c0_g2_i1.p1 TRINITY_DN1281_c0_g2~~TRINITY_DN1281_c0_g2_i1.p1  ORF type:complete len:412 (-),score=78.87 TRINITY_DN1281_c0_g2_i1:668-1903(-)
MVATAVHVLLVTNLACVAALQTGSEASGKLPSYTQLARKPRKSIEHIGEEVLRLQEHLKDLKKQRIETVQAQEKENTLKLVKQKKELDALEHENRHLAENLEHVQNECAALRKRATDLKAASNDLLEQGRMIQENLTFTADFVDSTLNDIHDKLHGSMSWQLSVLDELAQKEIAEKEAKAREQALSAVSASAVPPTSLLQTHSEAQQSSDAQADDLATGLAKAIESMNEDRRAALAALQRNFEREFGAGEADKQSLLTRNAKLADDIKSAKETETQLKQAVRHLAETHQALKQQLHGLRVFLRSTSARSMPDTYEVQRAAHAWNDISTGRVNLKAKAKARPPLKAHRNSALQAKRVSTKSFRQKSDRVAEDDKIAMAQTKSEIPVPPTTHLSQISSKPSEEQRSWLSFLWR